jgi:uncharacterized integral membrane protein
MKLKLLSILLLVLAVGLFSAQNAVVITLRFFVWEFAVSQALVILVAVVFGILLGWMLGFFGRKRSMPPSAERGATDRPAPPLP